MLAVERASRLPDGEDEMEQLRMQGSIATSPLPAGPEPTIQGSDAGVASDGHPSGIPEVAAGQIISFWLMCFVPVGKRLAQLVDAGASFSAGKMLK